MRYPILADVMSDDVPGHTAVILQTATSGDYRFAAVCSCMSPAQAAHCGSQPRYRAGLTALMHVKHAA